MKSLRTKTWLLVIAVWMASFLPLFFMVRFVSLRNMDRLEMNEYREELHRAIGILLREQAHLETTTKNWAQWDDTLNYINTRDPNYEKSNLVPTLFSDYKINLVIILDGRGQVVYRACRDYQNQQNIEIPEFMGKTFPEDHPFIRQCQIKDSFVGWYQTSKGILMMAARRISHSDGSGPSNGIFIMGRFWDETTMNNLRELIQFPLDFLALNDERITPAERELIASCENPFDFRLHPVNKTIMNGLAVFSDITGQDRFFLRVPMDRTLFSEARRGFNLLFAGIMIIISISGILILLLMEKTILLRLTRLSSSVNALSHANPARLNLVDFGQDELTQLRDHINHMLDQIAERNRALNESEKRFRSYLENFPGIAYQMDHAQRYLFLYGDILDICGCTADDLLSGKMAWRDLVHPDDLRGAQAEFAQLLPPAKAPTVERYYRILRPDGQSRHVMEKIRRLSPAENSSWLVEGSIYDVTRQKAMEQHVQQVQNLEAIGLLASGIAHDFNNVLQGIIGHTLLAKKAVLNGNQEKSLDHITVIDKASQRGAALVRELLTFCRQDKPVFEGVSLNAVVLEVHQFIQRTFPRNIRFETMLAEGMPPAHANRSQVQQMLLNLCVNARDAMPEGGTLTFQTALTVYQNNPMLQLQVRDTGVGMSESVKSHIFTPFFTTKAPGQGTGLGLSMVYGAMHSCNGLINCTSKLGAGTEFSLYFQMAETIPAVAARDPAPLSTLETA